MPFFLHLSLPVSESQHCEAEIQRPESHNHSASPFSFPKPPSSHLHLCKPQLPPFSKESQLRVELTRKNQCPHEHFEAQTQESFLFNFFMFYFMYMGVLPSLVATGCRRGHLILWVCITGMWTMWGWWESSPRFSCRTTSVLMFELSLKPLSKNS